VLGNEIATRLRARVGEKVVLATLHGAVQSPLGLVPRLKPFRVAGIFQSGLYEYDSSLAYISIAAARDLFEIPGMTGIQMKIVDLFEAPAFAARCSRTWAATRSAPATGSSRTRISSAS
jgi:lipoprotein-releasing system permease protein